MSTTSAINDGFRAAFREPAIVLAEIAWRWSFGVAAWALVVASLFAYLDGLPVSNRESLLLHGDTRWLIAAAAGPILQNSARLLRAVALLVPAILVLWTAAATIGRAATLKALLGREAPIAFSPQLGLNFLRATMSLAALIGYLGAAIVAGHMSVGPYDVRPRVFLLVFVALAAIVAAVRSRLNSFLCLAAISAAREGRDTFTAIATAVSLFRRNAGRFALAGAAFAAVHSVLFAFCTVICLLVLSLAGKVVPAATLFLLAVITLAYFAAVDFLYIARLGAYIAIDESDRTPPRPAVAEPTSPAPQPDLPLISGPGLPSPEGASS